MLDSLNEIYSKFEQALIAAKGGTVTFRVFDLQPDKKPQFLRTLNYDKYDFYLRHPWGRQIAIDQLRAFLRLWKRGHRNQKIMFPMVKTMEDMKIINGLLNEALQAENWQDAAGIFDLGIMVETREAVENIEDLLAYEFKLSAAKPASAKLKFISVGTNDLIRSLYGARRDNAVDAKRFYGPVLPGVVRLIQHIALAAGRREVDISICGNLAAKNRFWLVWYYLAYKALKPVRINLSMPDKDVYSFSALVQAIKKLDKDRKLQTAFAEIAEALSRCGSISEILERKDERPKAKELMTEVLSVAQDVVNNTIARAALGKKRFLEYKEIQDKARVVTVDMANDKLPDSRKIFVVEGEEGVSREAAKKLWDFMAKHSVKFHSKKLVLGVELLKDSAEGNFASAGEKVYLTDAASLLSLKLAKGQTIMVRVFEFDISNESKDGRIDTSVLEELKDGGELETVLREAKKAFSPDTFEATWHSDTPVLQIVDAGGLHSRPKEAIASLARHFKGLVLEMQVVSKDREAEPGSTERILFESRLTLDMHDIIPAGSFIRILPFRKRHIKSREKIEEETGVMVSSKNEMLEPIHDDDLVLDIDGTLYNFWELIVPILNVDKEHEELIKKILNKVNPGLAKIYFDPTPSDNRPKPKDAVDKPRAPPAVPGSFSSMITVGAVAAALAVTHLAGAEPVFQASDLSGLQPSMKHEAVKPDFWMLQMATNAHKPELGFWMLKTATGAAARSAAIPAPFIPREDVRGVARILWGESSNEDAVSWKAKLNTYVNKMNKGETLLGTMKRVCKAYRTNSPQYSRSAAPEDFNKADSARWRALLFTVNTFVPEAGWPYYFHANYSALEGKTIQEKEARLMRLWGNDVDFKNKKLINFEYFLGRIASVNTAPNERPIASQMNRSREVAPANPAVSAGRARAVPPQPQSQTNAPVFIESPLAAAPVNLPEILGAGTQAAGFSIIDVLFLIAFKLGLVFSKRAVVRIASGQASLTAGSSSIAAPMDAAVTSAAISQLIPGTVWVPVEIVWPLQKDYARLEKDIQSGLLKLGDDGRLYACVIRNPGTLSEISLHGRTVFSEVTANEIGSGVMTIVAKGAGLEEPVAGVPYGYDANNKTRTQRFRGGALKENTEFEINNAISIHRAFAEGIEKVDPSLILARDKYGVDEAPTLKPLYLLKPLSIPVQTKDGLKYISPRDAFNAAGIVGSEIDRLVKEQVVYIYEVPVNKRLSEWYGNPDTRMGSLFGTDDKTEILKKFAARLAVMSHLMHNYLNTVFDPRADFGFQAKDVTIGGYTLDLDNMVVDGAKWKSDQDLDHYLAKKLISRFAGELGIPEEAGIETYLNVRSPSGAGYIFNSTIDGKAAGGMNADQALELERRKEFEIYTEANFDFPGAAIEQRRYDLPDIWEEKILPVLKVKLNGNPFDIGKGHYVVITLANGKKIYWGGQHNLTYSFFFEHYKDKANDVVALGKPWFHIDAHDDMGYFKDEKVELTNDFYWPDQRQAGLGLSEATYFGNMVNNGIVRNYDFYDSVRSVLMLAQDRISGGIMDLDIDVTVGVANNKIDGYKNFARMRKALVSIAKRSEVIFLTNSSELSRLSLGAPFYIDPHAAIAFAGTFIEDLAKASTPDAAKKAKPRFPDVSPGVERPDELIRDAMVLIDKDRYLDAHAALKKAIKDLRAIVEAGANAQKGTRAREIRKAAINSIADAKRILSRVEEKISDAGSTIGREKNLARAFRSLLAGDMPPLEAFIKLMGDQKMHPVELRIALVNQGLRVRHLDSNYAVYRYWRVNGIDVKESYDFRHAMGIKKSGDLKGLGEDEIRELLPHVDKIGLPDAGFYREVQRYLDPPANHHQAVNFYLRRILEGLGKVKATSDEPLEPAKMAEPVEGLGEYRMIPDPDLSLDGIKDGYENTQDIFALTMDTSPLPAYNVLAKGPSVLDRLAGYEELDILRNLLGNDAVEMALELYSIHARKRSPEQNTELRKLITQMRRKLRKSVFVLPVYTEDVLTALENAGGNQSKAARALGISKQVMSRRIQVIERRAKNIGATVTLKRLEKALSSLRRIRAIRGAAVKAGDLATLERIGTILPDKDAAINAGAALEAEANRINEESLKCIQDLPGKTILCHIVTDSILPLGQRNMLKSLEQDMRDSKYIEKVVSLSIEGSDDPQAFMAELGKIKAREEARYQGYKVQFDVACPDKKLVAGIQGLGMQALAFTQEGEGDIVQVQGIILALRALQTGSIDNLLSAYKLLAGKDLSSSTGDINELARMITFILPVRKLNVNNIAAFNRLIEEHIKSAA